MIEQFKDFLTKEGCLDKFITNTETLDYTQTLEELAETNNPADYVMDAFSWHDSPEGGEFWEDINAKWENIVDDE